MNCKTLRPEIIPYYQNELSPEDRAGFERHVQLCESCARLSHEMSQAMELSQATLARRHAADIAPRVRAVLLHVPSLLVRFRWVIIPAISALLLASLITSTVTRPLPPLHPEALSLAQDLAMFEDYEVLASFDDLETGSGQENEAQAL